MKDIETLKNIDTKMKNVIWTREERMCRICHKPLYKMLEPRGHIHHINANRQDNRSKNLLLVCRTCHKKLHCLYRDDTFKYAWEIELILKEKTQYPEGHSKDYIQSYRYHRAKVLIDKLEQENNILSLPQEEAEKLLYLKRLKGELIREHEREIREEKEKEEEE